MKLIRYGGMRTKDALKTLTINGAKILEVEKYVGTLESVQFVIVDHTQLDSSNLRPGCHQAQVH